MKARYSLLIILLASSWLPAQDAFRAGKITFPDGKTIRAFIKDTDSRSVPTQIEYRRSAKGRTKRANVADITSFQIGERVRYENRDVVANLYKNMTKPLEAIPGPGTEQRLLLRVEVLGPLSLYAYEQKGARHFFVDQGEGRIVQLRHARILKADRTATVTQRRYREQLKRLIDCPELLADIAELGYTQRELRNLIKEANICTGGEQTVFKRSGTQLRYGLQAGISFNSQENNVSNTRLPSGSLNNGGGVRVGGILALALPYRNQRIEALFTPNLYQFADSKVFPTVIGTGGEPFTASLDYTALELPLGAQYFINKSSSFKPFVGASFSYTLFFSEDGLSYNQTQHGRDFTNNFALKNAFGGGLHVGALYGDHISLTLRYNFHLENIAPTSINSTGNGWWIAAGYTL